MKLINYAKYQGKNWSPKASIISAVVQAVITGFFLGMSVIEAAGRHDFWRWVWPLTLGFASGVGALQATLIALHAISAKSPQHESAISSSD